MGASYQGAFIEHAWKWLIQNHPHDSICGCSLDRVHEDMITRFNWCFDNASDVASYSCAAILSGINKEKLLDEIKQRINVTKGKTDVQLIGVFNSNPFTGPFIVEGYVPLLDKHTYQMYDWDGNEINSMYIEYIPDYRQNIEEGEYIYKQFLNHFVLGKLTAKLEQIPACGYKIYYIVGEENKPEVNLPQPWVPQPISTENYIVSFNTNGSINVEDLKTQHVYQNLNILEDGADDGDEYDYGPLPNDVPRYTAQSQAIYTILTKNDLFTEIQADLEFEIPFELLGDADSVRTRSAQTTILQPKIRYRIYKTYPRIDVKLTVTNKAKVIDFGLYFLRTLKQRIPMPMITSW